MPYEQLDHTGDIGLRITAESLEGIFTEAASAFLEIVSDPTQVHAVEQTPVEVEGDDLADLLNRWLTWLLLRLVIDGRLVREVRAPVVRGNRFCAEVAGELFDPERHELRTELKAVTYHQLYVRPLSATAGGAAGWEAQVIFDV